MLKTKTPQLAEIELPDFGSPTVQPLLDKSDYKHRLKTLGNHAAEHRLDVLLVWGDREHFANLMHLTGYDPRFEEALLAISCHSRPPVLVLGNEGMGMSMASPLTIERRLYQPFSLMGQDRSKSPPLADLLKELGIQKGSRVGIVDWKYFGKEAGSSSEHWINAPAYLVDAIRILTGDSPVNATALMMNPADGMRAVSGADQLAVFEFNSTLSSNCMRRMLRAVRPGMTEIELMETGRLPGIQQCMHPAVTAGPAAGALPSPSMRPMQLGDPFVCVVGLYGALQCRAGFLVHSADELPREIHDYADRLVKPYFSAVAAWYEMVGIGVEGGDLYDAVHRIIGDPFFGITLNPGHLIHLDEWLHSPIFQGSKIPLRSGMALQADIIPATGGPYFTSNMEDGIALADEPLRSEMAQKWPEAWSRIQARRRFMIEDLGIHLKPEVLPLSNLAAHLCPYLLSPSTALKMG